jgi:uncharacterized membrane protein YdjX (TVP38/TMEM64 family)
MQRGKLFTALLVFIAAALCSVTILSTANGQVLYGSIVGAITDSTGAVIANADITITEAATGLHNAR